jgi:hypothetical protein
MFPESVGGAEATSGVDAGCAEGVATTRGGSFFSKTGGGTYAGAVVAVRASDPREGSAIDGSEISDTTESVEDAVGLTTGARTTDTAPEKRTVSVPTAIAATIPKSSRRRDMFIR